MKKIIAYIAVLAAFAAVSCNHVVEKDFEPMDSSMLTLSLNTSEMSTRASAIPAVEPVVTQLDWFFYADDSGTSKPKYHGHITVNADKSLTPSGTHTPTQAPDVDDDGIINLGFDLANTYTGISVGYKVYVLANYPGIDHSNENNLTLQKLLALEMDTNFDEKSSGYETINDFVMDSYSGNDEATYPQLIPLTTATTETADKTTAHLKVELRRVAAKITFTLEISDMLEDPSNASLPAAQKTYWSPLTASENFTTYMVNTINHATMAGTPVDAETMAPTLITGDGVMTGGHQTSYATSHVKTAKDTGTPALKWELDPFYTYPVEFETDSNNAPYLKIALPWQNVDANRVLTDKGTTVYYYKVYIADASGKPLKKFERNKHYVVKLNIKELGGTLEDYVLLTTEFYVADWQTPAEGVYQGYHNPRFLDIARPVYYIYGDNELTVAVTSSHNIKAEIIGVSQTTIKGAPKMSNDDLAALKTNATRPVTVTTDGKVSFKLHYDLDTTLDMTDGATGLPAIYGQMDLSPITWQLRISHEDLEGYPASYTREVTIIQYPSIYGELNHTNRAQSRYVNRYGSTTDATTNAWNNHGSSSANEGNTLLDYPTTLGGVRTYSGKSWDKTVLTISTLASFMATSTTQYNWVLGDPRVRLADSGLYTTAINGTTWGRDDLGSADSNYLDDYLVADPNKGNYIAPRFMITSGLAADANHTNEHWKNAAERCASYQEDGYPAGRWRLPTEAEIEFVIQLENTDNSASGEDNYLDPANVIFHPDHSYWASTGRYYYGKEHEFTTPGTVRPYLDQNTWHVAVSNRCVYDLWYWGEEKYNGAGVKITEGVTDTTPAEQWIGFKMD